MSNYNKIIQYGGNASMVTDLNNLCFGEELHHEYLTRVNNEYVKLLASNSLDQKIDLKTIDDCLIKDHMNIMNIRLLYLLFYKHSSDMAGATPMSWDPVIENWPLGKTFADLTPPALKVPDAQKISEYKQKNSSWNAEALWGIGDDKFSIIKWGVPAHPYNYQFSYYRRNFTDDTDVHVLGLIVIIEVIQGAEITGVREKWDTMNGDIQVSIFKLLNSFRNFVYLKEFLKKAESTDLDILDQMVQKISNTLPTTASARSKIKNKPLFDGIIK